MTTGTSFLLLSSSFLGFRLVPLWLSGLGWSSTGRGLPKALLSRWFEKDADKKQRRRSATTRAVTWAPQSPTREISKM